MNDDSSPIYKNFHQKSKKPAELSPHGYTQVENYLFAQMSRLTGNAVKVAFAVARFTWGYQKISAPIPMRTLRVLTGCSFDALSRALRQLIKAKLLHVQAGNWKRREANIYRLKIPRSYNRSVRSYKRSDPRSYNRSFLNKNKRERSHFLPHGKNLSVVRDRPEARERSVLQQYTSNS